MLSVEPGRLTEVAALWGGETPGPDAVLGHVAHTGCGQAWVDRWPRPAVLLAETGGNYVLKGDPAAVDPAALRPLVRGFLAAPAGFDAVLDEAFPDRIRWERVIYQFPGTAGAPATPPGTVRRLHAEDAPALERLSEDVRWVAKTWGGPAGLAASGHAYGAFDGDRLAAVTCTFFRGFRHDDAGVATEPELRGRGLGTASALAWCADILAQGRVPTWTTSVDNAPSRGIAKRLGFELVRRDVLHVIGIEVPPVATYDEQGGDAEAHVGRPPDVAEAPGAVPTG